MHGMKFKICMTVFIAFSAMIAMALNTKTMKNVSEYKVVKLEKSITIDADWDKAEWQKVEAIQLENFMGDVPRFRPGVKVRIMYDDKNLYVIFQVEDHFVRCVTKETNGPVYEDSCVEFFFSPDENSPLKYFNLEINCGGTALMFYNLVPSKDYKIIDPVDIQKIEIAHSMPQIVVPEIQESVIWTLEYRLPISLLKKYATVSQPAPGVVWKGNCYKIGDKTSNPHYQTWAQVDQPKPDFHLPAYFGDLIFQ